MAFVPHELIISDELETTATPTSLGNAAVQKYREDIAPYGADKQHEWADINMKLPRSVPIEEMMQDSALNLLNGPLQEERGYSIEDVAAVLLWDPRFVRP